MRIYFARHGKTDDNENGIMQGRRDTELNDTGREQASLLAERLEDLSIKDIYSSPLSRARETAEICAEPHEGLTVQVEGGLIERYLASWQGLEWSKNLPPDENIESQAAVQERVSRWLKSFLENTQHIDDPSYSVLVVTHAPVLKNLKRVLLDPLNDNWRFETSPSLVSSSHCDNASLMSLDVTRGPEGKFVGTIDSWNDTKHLAGHEELIARKADEANT